MSDVQSKSIEDIMHNCRVAEPTFLFFIKNMKLELARWIQYNGVTIENGGVYFNFKSSQNSLNFQVYAGVCTHELLETTLLANSNFIYGYFRAIKYENIA